MEKKPQVGDFAYPITKLSLPTWEELAPDFKEIIESGMITNNRKCAEFERALEAHLDVPHAVCVSSGTSALILALKCLNETGRTKGSEVIVPSFTFIASPNAIEWAGFTPRFVDCEPDTFNVDPEKIQEAITDSTAAIMPVHIFGNPCDIKTIGEIAQANDLPVVWDSCEAFGAKYHARRVGSFNSVDVTSGAATKLLSISEGGIIGTADEELAELIREARNAGNFDKLTFPGLSARMTEFQAVMGLHQLPKVDGYMEARNRIAEVYRKELEDVEGLQIQAQNERCKSTWFSMPVVLDEKKLGISRKDLKEQLLTKKIWARDIWFDPACHNHPAYKDVYCYMDNLKLPNTEYLEKHILCLPMWSHMTPEEAIAVCDAVKEAVKHG